MQLYIWLPLCQLKTRCPVAEGSMDIAICSQQSHTHCPSASNTTPTFPAGNILGLGVVRAALILVQQPVQKSGSLGDVQPLQRPWCHTPCGWWRGTQLPPGRLLTGEGPGRPALVPRAGFVVEEAAGSPSG